MTFSFLGPDPVEQQVEAVLGRLAARDRSADVEVAQVDVKEEPGRRAGRSRSPGARDGLVVGWTRARGRVSSTEVADLLGLSVPSSGGILAALEEQGLLAGGREQKLGRGFYYVPVSEL